LAARRRGHPAEADLRDEEREAFMGATDLEASPPHKAIAGAGCGHLSPTLAYRFVEIIQLS
jgi:hypothetical protein